MKKFKFYTVTPLFTENTDFVVDNVRRLRGDAGRLPQSQTGAGGG